MYQFGYSHLATMLPFPIVPPFPVPDDEAVVVTFSVGVAPLLAVIVRRDREEKDGRGHDGQNGERANRSQRHFELPGREAIVSDFAWDIISSVHHLL